MSKDVIKWEEVAEMRKTTVEELISNQGFLNSLVTGFKPQIDKDKTLQEAIAGMFNSLSDIAKLVAETTKQHAEVNDKGEVVKLKTGVVSADSPEYLDYMTVQNNYLQIAQSVVNIVGLGYQEIVTKINEQTHELDDKEVKAIEDTSLKEQVKLLKKMQNAVAQKYNLNSKKTKKKDRPKRKPKQDLPYNVINYKPQQGEEHGK